MKMVDLEEIGRMKFRNAELDFYVYLPPLEWEEFLDYVVLNMNFRIPPGVTRKDVRQVEAWGIFFRWKDES